MNKKRAFTLIEMLVVVVLIGIVLAIVIPSVTSLVSNEGKKKYNTFVPILDKATELYVDQYKGQILGKDSTCFNIQYDTLIKDGLIKEEDIKCSGNIIINKENGSKVGHDYYLTCLDNKGKEVSSSGKLPTGCLGFNGKFKMSYQMYTDSSKTKTYDGSYYLGSSYLEFSSTSPYTNQVSYYEITTNIDGGWTKINSPFTTSTLSSLKNYNGTLYVRAVDSDNNRSDVISFSIKLDNTGPTFNTGVAGDSVSKTVTVKDVQDKQVGTLHSDAYSFNNGASWQSGNTYNFTSGGSADVCVRDSLGNKTCKKVVISWLDREDVIISASDKVISGNWHKEAFDLVFSLKSPVGVITYYYGLTNNPNTLGGKTTISDNTTGTLYYVKACDSYGFCSKITNYNVKLDKTVPSLPKITATDNIGSGNWHTVNFDLNFSGGSNISGNTYLYSTDNSNFTSANKVVINTNTNGTTYYVKSCSGAGLCSGVSNYLVRLDKDLPTAPVITGGDNNWATSRVISISNNSTSVSGIKNYQYYISTSISSQTGGSWINLASGGNSVTITTNGERYIYYRAVSNTGAVGFVSNYQVTKIDTSKPALPNFKASDSIGSGGWHTANFTLTLSGSSNISGNTYYIDTSNNPTTIRNTYAVNSETSSTVYYGKSCSGAGLCEIVSYTAKLDRTLPTVYYSVGGGTYTTSKTVTVTGSDTNYNYMNVHVYKDGAKQINKSVDGLTDKTFNVDLDSGGKWIIYSYVVDQAGRSQNQTPKTGEGWYYQDYTITLCSYSTGKTWEYNYTGGIQGFSVPCNGTYKLEVSGAEGGSASGNSYASGGAGGYAAGNVSLSKNTAIYIGVGGEGIDAVSNKGLGLNGGYNGGGMGNSHVSTTGGHWWVGGSGGGATHIVKNSNRGTLSNYASYTSEVLIVAGGGGGGVVRAGWNDEGEAVIGTYKGGSGGGINGVDGEASYAFYAGYGGTQTAGGASNIGTKSTFGQGGSQNQGGAGGGGGLYGGGASYAYGAGGGGSGYIGGVTDGTTCAVSRLGNGTAKITLVTISN